MNPADGDFDQQDCDLIICESDAGLMSSLGVQASGGMSTFLINTSTSGYGSIRCWVIPSLGYTKQAVKLTNLTKIEIASQVISSQ